MREDERATVWTQTMGREVTAEDSGRQHEKPGEEG